MTHKNVNERCRDLTDLVKNIVLGFCKINVPYAERLDIYGSLHVRADNCDVANFMLNEHCYNNSRASSPTVTSAQTVAQESEGTDDNLPSAQGSENNIQKRIVKTETSSAGTEENQNGLADMQFQQWFDAESATSRRQRKSFPQPWCGSDQPVSAWSGDSASHESGRVSEYFVSRAGSDIEGHVKCEAAVNDDQLSNDGSVEILDDDPESYRQDNGYENNVVSETAEFKSEFWKTEEDYETEMPFQYEEYDDSNAPAYQYPNMSVNNYFGKQPRAANSAKRRKPRASSVGQNTPSTLEKICEFCQERFVSDDELSVHFQQYHQCPVPPVDSSHQKRKTHLHQVDQTPGGHLAGSPEECVFRMYKCRFCSQMFKSLDGLRNHENVKHSGNKRYRCNFCSQEFLTRQSAYVHRIKFHRLLVRKMR